MARDTLAKDRQWLTERNNKLLETEARLNNAFAGFLGLQCIYDLTMITFDETKRQANIGKHGIDLAALSGFFDGDLLTREDERVAYGELRFQSVGWHAGEMLFVV